MPTPPPAEPNRRPQRVHNLEANTGLQLPLSTLRERRRRLPRKIRFRLAGCASTGRASNPLDRFERFQVTSILLSRTSPVARVVYAKPPFAGPEAVLAYLARYTHRVALSNNRLLAIEEGRVRFRWKDYRNGNRQKAMTLAADEFIRRFLLHVLPEGFQRIRYYGFLAHRHREHKLARCRQLLAMPQPEVGDEAAGQDYRDQYRQLTGISLIECPACQRGRMVIIEVLKPARPCRPLCDTSCRGRSSRLRLTACCQATAGCCCPANQHHCGRSLRPLSAPPPAAGCFSTAAGATDLHAATRSTISTREHRRHSIPIAAASVPRFSPTRF